MGDATIAATGAIATAQLTFAKVVSQAEADCTAAIAAADAKKQKAEADAATAIAQAEAQKLLADATAELVCAAQIENSVTHAGESFVKATDAYVGALVSTATAAAGTISGAVTSVVASWQATQGTHYAD